MTALDEFAFLKDEKGALNETIVPALEETEQGGSVASASDEVWNVDQNTIKQMKEKYRSEFFGSNFWRAHYG